MLMDRAYEGDAMREIVRNFGMDPVVPPKRNRLEPWEYDHESYKKRNAVERLFRRLKGGVVCFHVLKNSILCLWALSKSP
jgi:transposase